MSGRRLIQFVKSASWFDRHLTEWIQPEKLRAPEVILQAPWDHKVDIWNLGLIVSTSCYTWRRARKPLLTIRHDQLWELVQGQLCFDGQATASADYTAEAHLAQMTSILGPFPTSLLNRSKSGHQYFIDNGSMLP